MGVTFKENCPDLRNTRVIDIIHELETYGIVVDVYDPWVDSAEAQREYGLEMTETPETRGYNSVIVAVAHEVFLHRNIVEGYAKKTPVSLTLRVSCHEMLGLCGYELQHLSIFSFRPRVPADLVDFPWSKARIMTAQEKMPSSAFLPKTRR